MEVEFDCAIRCLLCKAAGVPSDFINIEDVALMSSKRSLKSLAEQVAKTANSNISFDKPICTVRCLETLVEICEEYNEISEKLLLVEQRFKALLKHPDEFIDVDFKNVEETVPKTVPVGIEDLSLENLSDIEEIAEESLQQLADINVDELSNTDIDDVDVNLDELYKEIELEESKLLKYFEISPKPSFKCRYCKKEFRDKNDRTVHIQDVHKNGYRCTICGIYMRDDEYFELHMNLHRGKTENECCYCPKRYKSKATVIRHMQKHWDKKKFQCEKCGDRFSVRSVLYNHRLQHEAEENPLVCTICHQTFKTKRTYKGHLLTHRKDRPRYGCTVCSKEFYEKYTLKVHMRTHSVIETNDECAVDNTHFMNERQESNPSPKNLRVYACVICGNMFDDSKQYYIHMECEHDVVLG